MRSAQLAFLMGAISVASVACQRTPAPAIAKPAPAPATPTTPEVAIEPAGKPGQEGDGWVLPGNLGPMTTRLELEARFGKTNLRVETFPGAEGDGSYPVLVLFPDDPRKRLELVQGEDNSEATVQELRVASDGSLWHDATGLHTGMTLAELVALNGAPVSFYGLDWDYGGAVQDWHGGKLANANDATIFRRVELVARKDAVDARLPEGDADFRSDDARYPTIGKDLVVGQFGISWPHEGGD